jgi:hypothetical protein
MELRVTKRGRDGRLKRGTAPGPGRLTNAEREERDRQVVAAVLERSRTPGVTQPSARDVRRLAAAVSHLCGELGFIRHRLIELEAHGRGVVATILALHESDGVHR